VFGFGFGASTGFGSNPFGSDPLEDPAGFGAGFSSRRFSACCTRSRYPFSYASSCAFLDFCCASVSELCVVGFVSGAGAGFGGGAVVCAVPVDFIP
jgi:hypothetical protein